MKLLGKLNSLDGLDEKFHECYSKSGDSYLLDVDLTGTGYDSALTKIKGERNDLKDKVAKLAKYEVLQDVEGFDPANVQDLMNKAASAGDPEAIEKIQRTFEKQIEQLKQENLAKDDLVKKSVLEKDNFIIESVAKSAAIKAGVSKDIVDDVVSLTRGKFSLDDNNKVVVVDDDGDTTYTTPTEFYNTDYKKLKPAYYEAADISGSGSKTTTTTTQKENLSSIEKIAAGLGNK